MRKSISIVVGVILGMAVSSHGAEVKRSTSVFDRPSVGGKQMEVVTESSSVLVVGSEEQNSEGNWVHVKTDRSEGWVLRDSLELRVRDSGYIDWPGKENSFWLWGSAGLAGMSANEFNYGLRTALGGQWFVNQMRRAFIGFAVTSPFSKEKLDANYNGKSQRYNTYFTFGYFALPPKTYMRFGLGLPILAGANRHFTYKLGASALAELGHDLWVGENSHLGVSFSYEYTGKSRQSMNFVQDLTHCVLGGCDASSPTPSASIFGLNLNYSFAP